MPSSERPIALVTGVGRTLGIGAAIAARLATEGWNVGHVGWRAYDARMPWRAEDGASDEITRLRAEGARSLGIEADLADPATADLVLERVTTELGPVRALVMAHCESVNSGLLDTTVEAFDRHFAVNARASWLLIRAFGQRYREPFGSGRIVALTSDHVVGNLPYGASKGALDRITLAAASELADRGNHRQRRQPRSRRHRLDERRDRARRGGGDAAPAPRPSSRHGGPCRLPLLARRRVGQRTTAPERRRTLRVPVAAGPFASRPAGGAGSPRRLGGSSAPRR